MQYHNTSHDTRHHRNIPDTNSTYPDRTFLTGRYVISSPPVTHFFNSFTGHAVVREECNASVATREECE